uniref:DUF4440 domain-containing protein n=1 Tax=Haemonchus contortus TaxID=6289 RepID=A0A7I4YH98_HAECO
MVMCKAILLALAFLATTPVYTQDSGQSLALRTTSSPFPWNLFDDGWFNSGWLHDLTQQIEKNFKNAFQNAGTSISTENGTTTVTAKIGGKQYTATFPETTKIFTSSSTVDINGQKSESFRLTVNDDTYIYKTVNGTTTVTNGKGEPISGGGPFHIGSR